jgi:hypothetical protein
MATGRKPGRDGTIDLALRVAYTFGDELPTPAQLRDQFGLKGKTAYNWLRIMRHARKATRKEPTE